jgi:prefoldin subunit 5
MLDALAIPPRLILRALDDLHTLADSLRRLTDSEGDLDDLVEAVKVLPRTEDELSANIALLREDLGALSALLTPLVASLQPLPVELRDLDETAEALERSMGQLQAMLSKLPGI